MHAQFAGTVYSIMPGIPGADLAFEECGTSTLDPSRLYRGNGPEQCSLRKISRSGAAIHAGEGLEPGQRIEFELSSGRRAGATVAWSSGPETGLAFAEEVDVVALLTRRLVSQIAERRSLPRVEVRRPVRLISNGRRSLATTRDICQGGVQLIADAALGIGDALRVELDRLPPIDGIVRWRRGSVIGVQFPNELSWQQVMPWIRSVQEEMSSSSLDPKRA